jgi:hypothetical protein
MVPGPADTTALVHSAYAGADTMGRPGNFFTHIIFYPTLSAAQALETWGAKDWRTSYPAGAPKKLAELDDQPFAGKLIGVETLTRFLAGKAIGEQELATLVCPTRLKSPKLCQDLLMKTLDGCLSAWNGNAARGRMYLAGEPGLIALLLYGVARLIPPGATVDQSFSTFENAHRTLRQFRLAFACGT